MRYLKKEWLLPSLPLVAPLWNEFWVWLMQFEVLIFYWRSCLWKKQIQESTLKTWRWGSASALLKCTKILNSSRLYQKFDRPSDVTQQWFCFNDFCLSKTFFSFPNQIDWIHLQLVSDSSSAESRLLLNSLLACLHGQHWPMPVIALLILDPATQWLGLVENRMRRKVKQNLANG